MQYWADIFCAIVAATAKGITVVEAAGNGNENFDLPIFNSTGLQKDSGAIVVGAGIPPTNHFDNDGFGASSVDRRASVADLVLELRQDRQRAGWGWHVTTLGYGDVQGGASENKLVHAAVLRHVERIADRHRRGRLPSGPGQGEKRRAADTRQGAQDPHVDRDAAGGRARCSRDTADRTAAEPPEGNATRYERREPMIPAVPLPANSRIRTPVNLKLKPGWRFDPDRRVFVSERGRTGDSRCRSAEAQPHRPDGAEPCVCGRGDPLACRT